MSDQMPTQLGKSGRAAVLFGGVLPAIAAGTISVMLPALSDAFGTATNGVLVKMVSTAAGLGMMVGAPIGGILADRMGRRFVLALGSLLFGVFGCGAMLATGLSELILARFVVGLATGSMAACFIAVIGDSFAEKDQSRWLGFNGAIATLSIVLLIPLVGALVDIGWRQGFLIYATGFPMLLLVLLGIPSRVPGGRGDRAEGRPGANGKIPWSPILLAVCVGTISTGTPLYWPFRLRELGIVAARDLAVYAVPNILMICGGALMFSLVRRRMSATSLFIVCGLLSAVGLSLIALGRTPLPVLLGLMAEGGAVGLLTPNLSKYGISVAPRDRMALTIGLMQGAAFGSPFLTQFALEPMSHAKGASAALLGIAGMSLALSAYMLVRRLGAPHVMSRR